jgi:glycosyltransferase involved in cell wall biosynthesis
MNTTQKPTVSVVIPVFNGAEFLADALDSVLAQTYQPVEVNVVDDSSEDETPRIAAAYASKVTYVRQRRGGPACARNTGIRAASGDWIALLDQDDVWMPELLEKLVKSATDTGADLVFCDAATLKNGIVVEPTHFERHHLKSRLEAETADGVLCNPFELLLEFGCFVLPSAALIKRDALLDIGLFDECIYCTDDMDLWLRLSLKYRFALVGKALVYRRIHAQNLSHDKWALLTGQIKVYEKLVGYAPALAPRAKWRKVLRRQRGPMLRQQGAGYMERGELLLARKSWAKGFRSSYSPRLAAYWLATFLPPSWVEALRNGKRQTLFVFGYKY